MALPYPTKVVLPFDIATAQDMNERHANDVALANGTGLDDAAVTPVKRSGGFKIGRIEQATLNSTGNKSITGVGFKPKYVEFEMISNSPADTSNIHGSGAMDENGNQYWQGNTSGPSGQVYRNGSSSHCIGYVGTTTSNPVFLASYVSMDADGFTINATPALTSTAFDVIYKAYA